MLSFIFAVTIPAPFPAVPALRGLELEDVIVPGPDVQIEAASGQLVAVPLVDSIAHQILEAPPAAG